jgi:hypothetical protein
MEVAVSETDGGMHNNSSQNVVSHDLWLILIYVIAILVDGTHSGCTAVEWPSTPEWRSSDDRE